MSFFSKYPLIEYIFTEKSGVAKKKLATNILRRAGFAEGTYTRSIHSRHRTLIVFLFQEGLEQPKTCVTLGLRGLIWKYRPMSKRY